MLFIVDGTGPAGPAYEKDMERGFCARLHKELGKSKSRYLRGPTALGFETDDLARQVVEQLREYRRLVGSNGGKLYLAGHSRGGAAVIMAAKMLRAEGVFISAMFLFDAVDRTFFLGNQLEVPGNVEFCYHARRDPALAGQLEPQVSASRDKLAACLGFPIGKRAVPLEDVLDRMIVSNEAAPQKCEPLRLAASAAFKEDEKLKMVMRSTFHISPREGLASDLSSIPFGNCGTRAESPCKYYEKFFAGSHGALGGAPIIDGRAPRILLKSDELAMREVQSWMYGFLLSHGLFS